MDLGITLRINGPRAADYEVYPLMYGVGSVRQRQDQSTTQDSDLEKSKQLAARV